MNVVPFRQWAGQDLPALRSISTPTGDVWLHHGASGASSLATIRAYLRHHTRVNGWATIGYSFLVAGGVVYEGRGPGRQGAHTRGQNRTSHGLLIAGDYSARPPADADLDALVALLRHGHKMRWWRAPALTGGHRDAPGASTSCPGGALHRLIPDINRRAAGSPAPTPKPEPETTWLEDIMSAGEKQLADIAAALTRGAEARERQAVATRALAALQAAEHAAKVRRFYQLDADPHSDGIHGDRVASGSRTLDDVGSDLRDAAQDAG